MRQRVALERALIHDPRLVLLDEPFIGLDEGSVAALVARLRGLRSQGALVVLATHDLDVAEGLFDEVVFIRDGRLVDARGAWSSMHGTTGANHNVGDSANSQRAVRILAIIIAPLEKK